MNKLYYLIPILSLSLISCTNDSPSDIKKENQNTTTLEASVTYEKSKSVKDILETNCISCHRESFKLGDLSLDNYADVKDAILNRGLIDRINKNKGEPGAMPQDGEKLLESEIDLIEQWKQEGLLEK